MIRGTRASRVLGEYRNMPPANMDALELVLLRVSEMVCELPWIREMDINPLIVDETGAVAVDVSIVVENVSPTLSEDTTVRMSGSKPMRSRKSARNSSIPCPRTFMPSASDMGCISARPMAASVS